MLITGALVLGCERQGSAGPQASSPEANPEDGRYYRVQLHLHGSLSEGSGSMRGHNAVARRLGTVDGLWWSDHDWRIAGHGTLSGFRFEGRRESYPVPYRDTPWTRDSEEQCEVFWVANATRGMAEHWARLSSDIVAEGRHSLEIGARSLPESTEWQRAGIHLRSQNLRLIVPLAADVEIELMVYPSTAYSENSQLAVRLELSRQPEGRAMLVYALGAPGEPRLERSDDQLLGIVPVNAPVGEWSSLVLHPTRDAVELGLGGRDNSLHTIHLEVQVRRGATGRLNVDQLRLRRRHSGAELLAWAEQMAASLAEEFKLFNHIGLEISYGTHLNVYLPQIELPDFELYPHGMPPSDVVAWAHERGGVVSYNHVFGTGKRVKERIGEYQERARYLIGHRAFGADLLEVGYPHRVLPLQQHLKVWDTLSRQCVFMTGIGTSDSHNQSHGWRSGNNYVSWVWAAGPERRQLISGLASGRVVFGDPMHFAGELYLETAEGIAMGQVVRTSEPYHDVVLRITEVPEGSTVRWIEHGQIAAQLEPPAGDFVHTFHVATGDYRFVRAELWKGNRGLAFSNCLYFEPLQAAR